MTYGKGESLEEYERSQTPWLHTALRSDEDAAENELQSVLSGSFMSVAGS
jgi:hypothetical protein